MNKEEINNEEEVENTTEKSTQEETPLSKEEQLEEQIKILNDNARANGDDITKWWVCKKEVDLAFSNAITEAAA